ncbi:MAG: cell surface protein SprA [Bacteroidetes bacterium]|nr:cell surface protein SprA [Bacteroidota bacterium]
MGSGKSNRNLLVILYLTLCFPFILYPGEARGQVPARAPDDTTGKSILKIDDVPGYPWISTSESPLFLNNPSNISYSVSYDPEKDEYIIYQKVGSFDYRAPLRMSPDEFRRYEYRRAMEDYWQSRITGKEAGFRSSLIPQIEIGGETFDRIFGSNIINIVPQGSAELIFGINVSKTDNPTLSEKLRTIPTFDFKEKIQMNVTGTIGDKMELGINYNTDAMFDFENRTKLQYAGKEDEILKSVEAGDVTLPLTGTLITGSHSLFGLKTEMQFGKMTVTTVLSQQKGESSVITAKGGAQVTEFEIYADDYEANRHFFLSQYFRDIYDASLKNLPSISSGINIERIEIWITNKTSSYDQARNIVAFTDLAENSNHIFNDVPEFQAVSGSPFYPDNNTNQLYGQLNTSYSGIRNVDRVTDVFNVLYPGFQIGRDYEKIENARKLNEREYTINRQLGYISLNTALNTDEVLAVAFEYTLNGQVYKVGEFSSDGIDAPQTLMLKLVKGTTLSPKYPTWDLMMKNIYSLGAGKLESGNFQLNVLYEDDKTGNAINYLPEGKLSEKVLLQVMGLDNLNSQLDWKPDGYFDFIDGVTVNMSRGKIIFPVIEPFGSHLRQQIGNDLIADKYVFQELYDSTRTVAQQMAEKNKFKMAGQFSSAVSSEISLNAVNIPAGSVKVTAGGVTLTENVDYTVDYNLGSVTIINASLLESSTPIQVSLESNQYFGFQTKTLVGTHFDYKFSDNFNIGGTVLHLTERPYTQKVVYGEEPISNTIWGLNTSYRTQSQALTNIIDKIPLLETKTPSTISFFGEFAHLVPGHSKAISSSGNSYIDDFESSEIPLDLKSFNSWTLSSIPRGQDALFPEAVLNNDLTSGFNRAKLAWYVIDPLFLRNGSSTPDHIKKNPDEQSSHFVREVYENEIFPNKESTTGIPTTLSVLNVAYYPEEKGPYNYDTDPGPFSKGMNPEGKLNDPESRWGGFMREVLTSDFETANVQYIEFWLMDPFVESTDHNGGDLYINLGNVSEDILRDSRKSFEHGLPGTAEVRNVDTTAWGRVPTVQSVVNAFDNDSESRQYQDVGLDGLGNVDEQSFFSDYLERSMMILNEDAYTEILKDPSSDDFHYSRGSDYDFEEKSILERYKKYNGPDGNSPTSEMSDESYPTSGSTIPDMEDVNRDNTLNETESYYQYRLSMRPSEMKVGSNFIVDEIEHEVTFPNGDNSRVKWYQFKIPITDYEKIVGTISDFKSIRFMRMFLTNFREPVIMRFAELNLVRAEWRKYNIAFMEGGERITVPEVNDGTFEISSVSIEENAGKIPVNYVLPPGFDRIVDPSNPQLRQLNEQSMVMKVQDLEDGDARAAYKNVNLDMRQYRRLRMEVHAEAVIGEPLYDDQLTAFIRIGTDYKSNFYEYEVPLKLTPPGIYDNNSQESRALVWPEENEFNIDLTILQDAKKERNRQMQEEGSSLSVSDVFAFSDGPNKVYVSGNPNLSNVKVIMVGVRNPIKTRNPNIDDGNRKSGEVWVNELRLSEFIEDGGWAAKGHLQARLADLGSVDLVGQASTPGWGSIEKSVNERSKEEFTEYDLSSTLELGKFFPEKTGVRLPVYVGFSESRVKPQYNPLDPDILLSDAIDEAPTEEVRDSIKSIAEDYTRRKTITVSNAGIEKKGEKKSQPWDISNLSVNYAYNEIYSTNTKTEIDVEKNHRASLNYNYNGSPANITPFKNVRFLNASVFRIIKDFNFYVFPRSITIRNDFSRFYNEVTTRNINNPNLKISPTFKKDFLWTRMYDVKYDITRQLKVDFTATNIARIDEPEGGVDRNRYKSEYEIWRDSIVHNIKNFGRNTSYNHYINVNYNLPINKLPLLSWLSSTARYGADYTWQAGAVYPDSLNINLGNTIRNNSQLTFTAMANLSSLYSKSKFLKNIETNTRPGASARMTPEYRTETYTRQNVNIRPDVVRSIVHNLSTRDVKVRIARKTGEEVKGIIEIINENRVHFTASEAVDGAIITIEGQVPVKRSPAIIAGEYFVRALMGIRSVSLSYTSSQGQFLPGYLPASKFLGMSNEDEMLAPGWPFVLGYNDRNFFDKAMNRGWITKDTMLNTPASYNNRFDLSARATIEPFPGMRIDVSADRRFQELASLYYVADRNGNFPDSTRNRNINGTFSISVISWGTAFEKISKTNDYVSPTFEAFKENLIIISRRRAEERSMADPGYNPNEDPLTGEPVGEDFKSGYGRTSREVMIPAFIAAYTKSDPDKVSLETFPSALRMMPNWRVTFDGFSRFDFVQKVFRSISISHQYRSTYQIGSYTTNMGYLENDDGISSIRDMQNNFVQQFEINAISLNEQFSPLINVDMNWRNSLTTRIEIKKSRMVSLNFSNNQISDSRINELIIGAGYRFDDVKIILRTGGRQRALESDLNLRFDLSIRDNRTVTRKLIEDVNQPVAGQKIFTAGITADYVLSDRFNLQFYADHTMNDPFVANTYPTSNTDVGFSLKFTLVQ